MCVGIGLCHQQGLPHRLRGIVLYDALPHAGEPRIVVPAYGDMGEVGDVPLAFQPRPLCLHIRKDLPVVSVDIGEMDELVVADAGEAKQASYAAVASLVPGVHAGQVRHPAIYGELQVQIREPGPDGLRPEPFQGLRRLLHAAQALHQIAQVVDLEHRRTVDAVVVGLAEIPVYDPAAGPLESLPVRGALPDDILLILGQALVPEVVGVMVGPHQVEFHAVTVPGLQKAIVQAILQKRSAVIPVPVVDEYIYPVVGRGRDLHLHHIGVGLVHVSPEGLPGPAMAGEFRHGVLHRLPFTHALGPEHPGAGLVAGVGRPYVGGYVVGVHKNGFLSFFMPVRCLRAAFAIVSFSL